MMGYESKVILQAPLMGSLMWPDSPQPEPQELRTIQNSVEPETPQPTMVTAWFGEPQAPLKIPPPYLWKALVAWRAMAMGPEARADLGSLMPETAETLAATAPLLYLQAVLYPA